MDNKRGFQKRIFLKGFGFCQIHRDFLVAAGLRLQQSNTKVVDTQKQENSKDMVAAGFCLGRRKLKLAATEFLGNLKIAPTIRLNVFVGAIHKSPNSLQNF